MSEADGTVLGLHTLRATAEDSKQFNIVLLSDGFVTARLPQFEADARAMVDHFLATPPFNKPPFSECFNVYRIDVSSLGGGADKPLCAEPGGTGQRVRTYFDSTFCYDGQTQRLLYGNADLARQVVSRFLRNWHQIMVIVDDPDYGGGGGDVAWFSRGSGDWKDVAIHEMGHSAFGLADEYDYGDVDHHPGGEPRQVNVSQEPDPARVKWRSLVTAGPQVPTRANPDCTKTDPGPPATPASTIGTFAGAKYHHCGLYRPSFDCKMRTTAKDFCRVCSEEIQRVLRPFVV